MREFESQQYELESLPIKGGRGLKEINLTSRVSV